MTTKTQDQDTLSFRRQSFPQTANVTVTIIFHRSNVSHTWHQQTSQYTYIIQQRPIPLLRYTTPHKDLTHAPALIHTRPVPYTQRTARGLQVDDALLLGGRAQSLLPEPLTGGLLVPVDTAGGSVEREAGEGATEAG